MRGTIFGLAAVLLWGLAPVTLKSLTGSLPGLLASTAIYALAALVALPWVVRAWTLGQATVGTWVQVIMIGIMLTSAFNLLLSLAAPAVRGITIGAIVALEPLMITLLTAALTRRRPDGRTVLTLLLSLVGVWLLVSAANAPTVERNDAPWAVALVVAGALLWSLAVVLAARLRTPWQPLQSSMVMIGTGSLPFLLLSPWLYESTRITWTADMVLGVAFMALGATLLANILWLRALRTLGPISTSLLINLAPLTTLFLSVVWLGESWGTRQVLGTMLVLFALSLGPLSRALHSSRPTPSQHS